MYAVFFLSSHMDRDGEERMIQCNEHECMWRYFFPSFCFGFLGGFCAGLGGLSFTFKREGMVWFLMEERVVFVL